MHKFRSAPLTDPDASFSFVVYGDMGVSAVPGAHDTAKYMVKEAMNGSSFVFHVGDISYARGIVSTFHTVFIKVCFNSMYIIPHHRNQHRLTALKELRHDTLSHFFDGLNYC